MTVRNVGIAASFDALCRLNQSDHVASTSASFGLKQITICLQRDLTVTVSHMGAVPPAVRLPSRATRLTPFKRDFTKSARCELLWFIDSDVRSAVTKVFIDTT